MKRTHLIQRLGSPPVGGPLKGLDNPFSFGGGLRNGGLSADAMALLRPIFAFDYMGAAEYEFGAVPQALDKLATTKELWAGWIELGEKDVAPVVDWDAPPSGKRGSDRPTLPLVAPPMVRIFILCPEADKDEVIARIKMIAKAKADRSEERVRLRDGARLAEALRGAKHCDTRGWLELDNGFLFFALRSMWEKTCELFEVEIPLERDPAETQANVEATSAPSQR